MTVSLKKNDKKFGIIDTDSSCLQIIQCQLSASQDTVDVDAPHRAGVSLVGAEALPIDRVPDVGLVVLGTGQQKVSLAVVLDLSDGAVVAVQHQRLLLRARSGTSITRAPKDIQHQILSWCR